MVIFDDRLVGSREAARYLDWDLYTVVGKARRGEIPAYKLGSRWRFRLSELDSLLQRVGSSEVPG